jgi:DNA polymerase-1
MKIGKFHDTMLMAFLLQTYPQSLKSLAYRLFRMEMEECDDVVGDKAGLDEVEDFDRVVRYSARDADATMRVFPVLWKEICDRGLREVYERDLATIPMIVDMMANGVGADRYRLEHLQKYFTIQMAKLQEEIDRYAGKGYTKVINPNSTQQVSDILYRILGLGKGIKLKPLKNEKGFSTDANALAKIKGKHPIVEKITQYRAYGKLVNTYIEVLLEKVGEGKGRIHTNLRITRVPHSGRLSSSDPNLMAQPVRTEEGNMVRKCFVADPGYKLVSFDYDQIEMRVMAHVSQDPTMIKLFLDGRDIHAETAARIFGVPLDKVDDKKHRYPTKRAGFGIIYSIGPKGLSDVLVSSGAGENWTEDACRKLIDEYFTVYPGIRQYIRDTRTCAMRHGMVKDMWGRFKYTPEVKSTLPYIKEEGLRKACNMPIQSGSQGIIKQAMVNVHRTYGANPNVKPLLQIHDDLLFELKEELLVGIVPTIEAVMVEAATLSVPILVSVKVGDDWGNMKPYTGGE